VISSRAGVIALILTAQTLANVGPLVIGLGLSAASAAGAYGVLAGWLVLAGVGYGMLNPTSTKAVMAWSPPSRRATLVGLKQVGLPFGGALGAALMPVGALVVGWRLSVALSGAIIAVAALASAVLYRDPPAAPSPPARARERPFRAVLVSRDLWLVAVATGIFAAMQTVWMAFSVRSSSPGSGPEAR
jgi:MFS family permease